jgi:quercetin dioxygenase-like cupin family protein
MTGRPMWRANGRSLVIQVCSVGAASSSSDSAKSSSALDNSLHKGGPEGVLYAPAMDTGEQTCVAEVVLPCGDIAESVEFYTDVLGFRVDRISPADAPALAVLSADGIQLRLEVRRAPSTPEAADGWNTGRAGMQYRDLLPERGGGRYVVSHIRVPGTGPVQDYAHFHRVGFQMIFCLRGWAKLVYEDQGPPFVMRAGDCILQPPEIRHRVLESGDSLEVIEVTSPAVHDTFGDHEIVLGSDPNSSGRLFNGQRFAHHCAATAEWNPWTTPGFSYCDLGVAAATNHTANAFVIRNHEAEGEIAPDHLSEAFLAIILRGEAVLDCGGKRKVVAGDAFSVPAKGVARLHHCTHEFEALLVRLPGSGHVGAST